MKNNGALVEIFRALKNPSKFGLIMGEIKADLPEIKIDIGNGIVLDKDDLVFSASILKDYAREYSIESTDAQLLGDKLNSSGTKLNSSGVDFSFTGAPYVAFDTLPDGNSRPIVTIPEGVATVWSTDATAFDAEATNFDLDSNDFKSTGTITLTDEIKTGDKVMLMATETNQLFYVIDKVIAF